MTKEHHFWAGQRSGEKKVYLLGKKVYLLRKKVYLLGKKAAGGGRPYCFPESLQGPIGGAL